MTTQYLTGPLNVGTMVAIRNSGFGRGMIVEYRGPLGPKGARVYGVEVGTSPDTSYIEVLEEQLEAEPGDRSRN